MCVCVCVSQVNGVIVSGLSHGKVVDILRRAEGVVQLTICRDSLSAANPRVPPPAANRALSLGPVWTDPGPDPCGSPEAAPGKPVEHPPGNGCNNTPLTTRCSVKIPSCFPTWLHEHGIYHISYIIYINWLYTA